MSSRALLRPSRFTNYICDSCLDKAHSSRRDTLLPRLFSTASSQSCNISPQHTPRKRHERRPISLNGARLAEYTHSLPFRPYSTAPAPPQHVAPRSAPLPHRRLLYLSGPDAAKFLHGLVTNAVDSARLSPFYTAFLDARGRVLWDAFVWVWPELVAAEGHWACYIEVDEREVELLKRHLKRHKLRSQLAIKDVPANGADGVRVWAAWGGAHDDVKDWEQIAGLEDPRAPGMYRYIAHAQRDSIAEGAEVVSAKEYHVQRYIHGIAEGPDDMPRESTLPMEANIDLNRGIDFKKGCYLGQELTIRTKHTGVVRKRILPVRFYKDNEDTADVDPAFQPQLQPGSDIKTLDDTGLIKKNRPTGKIIAAIGNVGLATCRLENMTSLRVSAEGGTYKEGMQFGVEAEGQVVKVQPVLYNWFIKRKEALWDKEAKRTARVVEEQHVDQ
ncbi:ccr4 associated factor [Pleosporales sp. CAS-2024a]